MNWTHAVQTGDLAAAGQLARTSDMQAGHSGLQALPVRQILGIPIHAATMPQVLQVCREAIESRRQLNIGVVNAAKMVNMGREPLLRQAVTSADLIVADGMGVVWASRLLGQPLPERVAGIDLFNRLLGLADQHGYSVYLLGATQEVLDRLVQRIASRYPNLRIAGYRNGYFDESRSKDVAEQIRAARPDMLFLGMTSPKKEIFLARWGPTLNIRICHGVGGSFDVLAGKVKRAPLVWQKLGMEWLYRVVQEPRRMWKRYLVTNALFAWSLFCEVARPRSRRLRHRVAGVR